MEKNRSVSDGSGEMRRRCDKAAAPTPRGAMVFLCWPSTILGRCWPGNVADLDPRDEGARLLRSGPFARHQRPGAMAVAHLRDVVCARGGADSHCRVVVRPRPGLLAR